MAARNNFWRTLLLQQLHYSKFCLGHGDWRVMAYSPVRTCIGLKRMGGAGQDAGKLICVSVYLHITYCSRVLWYIYNVKLLVTYWQ